MGWTTYGLNLLYIGRYIKIAIRTFFPISGNPFFRISWVSGCVRGFTCHLGDSFGVKFPTKDGGGFLDLCQGKFPSAAFFGFNLSHVPLLLWMEKRRLPTEKTMGEFSRTEVLQTRLFNNDFSDFLSQVFNETIIQHEKESLVDCFFCSVISMSFLSIPGLKQIIYYSKIIFHSRGFQRSLLFSSDLFHQQFWETWSAWLTG